MVRLITLHVLILFISTGNIWGNIQPGYLDFDNLPETNFSCEGKVIGGYYADVETGCQMFHVCTIGQKGEVSDIKFLCLNGTVFDQETRVCERIDEVDCAQSESFFGLNLELYGNTPPASVSECEGECGGEDDEEEEEDYEDEEYHETTTPSTTTSTTTTTTTTTTTLPPPVRSTTRYPGTAPGALLALHQAFDEAARRPPTTRRPSISLNLRTRFSTERRPEQYTVRGRPGYLYQTTPTSSLLHSAPPPSSFPSNYHHFESSNTRFTHSFGPEKYELELVKSSPAPFRARLEEPVSIVTSTSTSTSVRRANSSLDYPEPYDYQDTLEPFFRDVPRLPRPKREVTVNQTSLDEEGNSTADYPLEYENGTWTKSSLLSSLLGSLGMEQKERAQVASLLEQSQDEMRPVVGRVDSLLLRLEDRLVRGLDHEFQYEPLPPRDKRDLHRYRAITVKIEDRPRLRKNRTLTTRRPAVTNPAVVKPVSEEIEGDVTTTEYRSGRGGQLAVTSAPTSRYQRPEEGFDYERKEGQQRGRVRGQRRGSERRSQLVEASSRTVRVRVPRPGGGLGQEDDSEESQRDTTALYRTASPSQRRQGGTALYRTASPSQRRQGGTALYTTHPTERSESRGQWSTLRSGGRHVQGSHLEEVVRQSEGRVVGSEHPAFKDLDELGRARNEAGTRRARPSTEEVPLVGLDHSAFKETSTVRTVKAGTRRVRPVTEEEPLVVGLDHSAFKDLGDASRVRTVKTGTRRVTPIPDDTHQIGADHLSKDLETSRVRTVKAGTRRVTPVTEEEPLVGLDHSAFKDLGETRLRNVKGGRLKPTPVTPSLLDDVRQVGPDHPAFKDLEEARQANPPTIYSPLGVSPDPDFSCDRKVKGGLYADVFADCHGFFICFQGRDGLEASHVWCGQGTKFNQKSRTCTAARLVHCASAHNYFHLNDNTYNPSHDLEDKLRGDFEPMRTG